MNDPLQLGNERQLFIDDYCIGELSGNARRRFHQAKKHPANPLMTAQDPELMIQVYGMVLFDPNMGLYRMWYNQRHDLTTYQGFAICHATSSDGIHWERTRLNPKSGSGKAPTNAVLTGYVRGPSVFHTPQDPDPARRFRMFVHTGPDIVGHPDRRAPFTAGYSVLFSADGFEWHPFERNPVVQGGDIATCMYDPVTNEYIAFPKIHRSDAPPEGHARRCVGVCISKDFTLWQTPDLILSADAIDDARVETRLERFRDLIIYDDPSFYSADMQGMTAFRCEGLRLGLIWFYDRCGARPIDLGGNDDGILNIQLAYSRNPDPYLGWKRAGDRHDFIPCGALGTYDCGMIFTACRVLERDDEVWIYYTGYDASHGYWGSKEPNKSLARIDRSDGSDSAGGTINLATIRRDGFASIDALFPGGSVTTKLLTFQGQRLMLNADAAHGEILVELTDHEGRPIPGYTKEQCIGLREDAVRGQVRWRTSQSLAPLQGKPIRATFHLKTARLYSFQFC